MTSVVIDSTMMLEFCINDYFDCSWLYFFALSNWWKRRVVSSHDYTFKTAVYISHNLCLIFTRTVCYPNAFQLTGLDQLTRNCNVKTLLRLTWWNNEEINWCWCILVTGSNFVVNIKLRWVPEISMPSGKIPSLTMKPNRCTSIAHEKCSFKSRKINHGKLRNY